MDAELQVEPIVCKDEIWRKACAAAELQKSIHASNPYPEGTRAHHLFQIYFWARERDLNGESSE